MASAMAADSAIRSLYSGYRNIVQSLKVWNRKHLESDQLVGIDSVHRMDTLTWNPYSHAQLLDIYSVM